jgi:hypothetical protein
MLSANTHRLAREQVQRNRIAAESVDHQPIKFLRIAAFQFLLEVVPAFLYQYTSASFQNVAPAPPYALAPTSKNRSSSAATTSGLFSGMKCPESTVMHLDWGISAEARRANPSGTAVSREP